MGGTRKLVLRVRDTLSFRNRNQLSSVRWGPIIAWAQRKSKCLKTAAGAALERRGVLW